MAIQNLTNGIDQKTLLNNISYINKKIIKNEFEISKRSKNQVFKLKYRFVSKDDYKKILLKLNYNDYVSCSSEDDPQTYGSGIVYVFNKLYPLYDINGDKTDILLYIKIKIPDEDGHLPVISFHESE